MLKAPTWLEINLDALVRNVGALRRAVGGDTGILLTVKADAYGHGAVQIAQVTDSLVRYFGVATLDEGLELHRAGYGDRTLILSPVLLDEIPSVADHGFAVTVTSTDFAHILSDHAVKTRNVVDVHVEVDSGMGRTGFFPADATAVIELVDRLPGLRLAGVFTHFPNSDSDPQLTRAQLRTFRAFVDDFRATYGAAPLLHSANSGALAGLPDTHMDIVRPGLAAYGMLPGGMESRLRLQPVMQWKSRLVQIREVPRGTPISYGGEHVTRRKTRLGIVPVGYGHGYPFRLSGRGEMLVGGCRVPILGRVTMDMTMVDLTDIAPAPAVEDEVVLVGQQGSGAVSVEDVATWAGTIGYEVLCGVSKRVPRYYIRSGKMEMVKSLLGVIPNTMP